jgi:hypothetical protein
MRQVIVSGAARRLIDADISPDVTEFARDVMELVAERNRLRAALELIQKWDCLNPPRSELCADHPWLKRLVDEVLS